MWGFRGVVTYIHDYSKKRRITAFFRNDFRRNPITPTSGISIVANLSGQTSACKTMRDFVDALKKSGIKFQTFDTNTEATSSNFHATRYDHVIEMIDSPFPDLPGIKKSRLLFWEFETGFAACYPHLRDGHALIAMSDFNLQIFQKELPCCKTSKILYPFRSYAADCTISPRTTRQKYNLQEEDFIVFFNFDYGSSFKRKNPDAVLRAFALAYRENAPNAKLVFKTMRAGSYPSNVAELKTLASELGIADRYISIDEWLSETDLISLTSSIDVYVSLHRGEGFGLGIAEAMSCGKPVVVTGYSAPMEFCNPQNAMIVPYKKRKIRKEEIDHPFFRDVNEWAEPDIHAAASALRRLYDNPTLRKRIGDSGKAFISSYFSSDNFRKSMDLFLGCQ